MKKFINKYNSKFSKLILAAFIFLNLSNIFHHHSFEFDTADCIAINLESGVQSINSSGIDCTVYQNFNSVHTLTFPKTLQITYDVKNEHQNLILSSDNLLSENFNLSHQLRAPPKIS